MLQANEKYFKNDTWIKYNEFYEFDVNSILGWFAQKKLENKGEIEPKLTRSIINCALKTIDISIKQEEIIKKCLKVDKRLI